MVVVGVDSMFPRDDDNESGSILNWNQLPHDYIKIKVDNKPKTIKYNKEIRPKINIRIQYLRLFLCLV